MEILIALKFFFNSITTNIIDSIHNYLNRTVSPEAKLFLVKILLASKLIDAKFFRTNEVTQQIYAVISVVKLSP